MLQGRQIHVSSGCRPPGRVLRWATAARFPARRLAGRSRPEPHGLVRPESASAAEHQDTNCILLLLVGGPSQLDTWDMKPNAPVEIRGPYKPIKTNVPGIEISENFPRMAKHADKYALIRSVYHTAAAVHDTGHQMMQTGRLFQGGIEYPHIGCVLSQAQRSEGRRAARTCCCRAPSATPAATCRTGRTPASWARPTIRSCSTPTPPIRISRCRTCCRRII